MLHSEQKSNEGANIKAASIQNFEIVPVKYIFKSFYKLIKS